MLNLGVLGFKKLKNNTITNLDTDSNGNIDFNALLASENKNADNNNLDVNKLVGDILMSNSQKPQPPQGRVYDVSNLLNQTNMEYNNYVNQAIQKANDLVSSLGINTNMPMSGENRAFFSLFSQALANKFLNTLLTNKAKVATSKIGATPKTLIGFGIPKTITTIQNDANSVNNNKMKLLSAIVGANKKGTNTKSNESFYTFLSKALPKYGDMTPDAQRALRAIVKSKFGVDMFAPTMQKNNLPTELQTLKNTNPKLYKKALDLYVSGGDWKSLLNPKKNNTKKKDTKKLKTGLGLTHSNMMIP